MPEDVDVIGLLGAGYGSDPQAQDPSLQSPDAGTFGQQPSESIQFTGSGGTVDTTSGGGGSDAPAAAPNVVTVPVTTVTAPPAPAAPMSQNTKLVLAGLVLAGILYVVLFQPQWLGIKKTNGRRRNKKRR